VDSMAALFQEGVSIREISRRTGQPFGTVRGQLIRAGVHRVKHRRVQNGMATCNSCRECKLVEEFPALPDGKYWCRDCLNKVAHEQQLRRMECSGDQFDSLLQVQGGKCAICGAKEGHRSRGGGSVASPSTTTTGRVRCAACFVTTATVGWADSRIRSRTSNPPFVISSGDSSSAEKADRKCNCRNAVLPGGVTKPLPRCPETSPERFRRGRKIRLAVLRSKVRKGRAVP
jgi:hypothetical protein